MVRQSAAHTKKTKNRSKRTDVEGSKMDDDKFYFSHSDSSSTLLNNNEFHNFTIMPHSKSFPVQTEGTPLGLWNLGNTCYANSVLQALYQCRLFRQGCIEERSNNADGLLGVLAQLFVQMTRHKRLRKTGYVNPVKFIDKLRERNGTFRTPEHHDAHEFYSFLLNEIGDELRKKKDSAITQCSSPFRNPFRRHFLSADNSPVLASTPISSTPAVSEQKSRSLFRANSNKQINDREWMHRTWLHDLFQGLLVYETRCLKCNNVSCREEPFFDIPVDVQSKQTNLTLLLLNFAKTEFLNGKNKYVCDTCGCLQDAERQLRFQRLPRILTIHLKRFNFNEAIGNFSRADHRVAFPVAFCFPKKSLTRIQALHAEDVIYSLFAVVVHVGTCISHGHYIACVYWNKGWWIVDDHQVKPTVESTLESFFGSSGESDNGLRCGYLLLYEMQDTSSFLKFKESSLSPSGDK